MYGPRGQQPGDSHVGSVSPAATRTRTLALTLTHTRTRTLTLTLTRTRTLTLALTRTHTPDRGPQQRAQRAAADPPV